MTRRQVRLDAEVGEQCAAAAHRQGVALSTWVNQALRQLLPQQPQPAPEAPSLHVHVDTAPQHDSAAQAATAAASGRHVLGRHPTRWS